MEFTVKKSDLLQELALAQAVVERKTTVPILSNVLLRANGANRVGVVATDMDVSFKSGCPRFPGWEKVMPENNGKAFVIGRDRIAAMIGRVATLADRKSKDVRFLLAPGSLRIESGDSGLGKASETTEVDYGNEEFQVAINYQYLLDFLETIPSGVDVSCEFKDGNSPVQFRPLGKEHCDHRYVVMPMRI